MKVKIDKGCVYGCKVVGGSSSSSWCTSTVFLTRLALDTTVQIAECMRDTLASNREYLRTETSVQIRIIRWWCRSQKRSLGSVLRHFAIRTRRAFDPFESRRQSELEWKVILIVFRTELF